MQRWADYVAETADSQCLKGLRGADESLLTQRESNDMDVSGGGETISIGAS